MNPQEEAIRRWLDEHFAEAQEAREADDGPHCMKVEPHEPHTGPDGRRCDGLRIVL